MSRRTASGLRVKAAKIWLSACCSSLSHSITQLSVFTLYPPISIFIGSMSAPLCDYERSVWIWIRACCNPIDPPVRLPV